jgi:hypothetical protein
MARWIVALPLLLVGSLLFWSLALSLGGLSLMRAMVLASPSGAVELGDVGAADVSDSAFTSGSIVVHLQESAEPEDLADPAETAESLPGDNSGAGGYVSPDEQAAAAPGPGPTSY